MGQPGVTWTWTPQVLADCYGAHRQQPWGLEDGCVSPPRQSLKPSLVPVWERSQLWIGSSCPGAVAIMVELEMALHSACGLAARYGTWRMERRWRKKRREEVEEGRSSSLSVLALTEILRWDMIHLFIFCKLKLMPSEFSTVQNTNVSSVTWTLQSISLWPIGQIGLNPVPSPRWSSTVRSL